MMVLHIPDGNVILWVQIHFFHSFFINFNPYPVDHGKCATLTVLIAAYAVSTCDHAIFPSRKSIAIMYCNSAWLFLAIFILDNYSRLHLLRLKYAWDRFWYNDTCAHSKWAWACRNRPRTPRITASVRRMTWCCASVSQVDRLMTVQSIPPRVHWWGAGWVSTFSNDYYTTQFFIIAWHR